MKKITTRSIYKDKLLHATHKLIAIVIMVLLTGSCSNPREKKEPPISNPEQGTDLIEITPFIINELMIKDTIRAESILKTHGKDVLLSDYNGWEERDIKFLNSIQFDVFKNVILKMLHDPTSKIYAPYSDTPLTKNELWKRLTICDTVRESLFDETGKVTVKHRFMCDSVSRIERISSIVFFESLFMNTKTFEIQHETLGYVIRQFDPEKEAFRQLFVAYKNEESKLKVKNFLRW